MGPKSHPQVTQFEKEFEEMKAKFTKDFETQLANMNIYLECDDGSGEVVNRNSGQRFKLVQVNDGNSQNVQGRKPIGGFVKPKSKSAKKEKSAGIGKFTH